MNLESYYIKTVQKKWEIERINTFCMWRSKWNDQIACNYLIHASKSIQPSRSLESSYFHIETQETVTFYAVVLIQRQWSCSRCNSMLWKSFSKKVLKGALASYDLFNLSPPYPSDIFTLSILWLYQHNGHLRRQMRSEWSNLPDELLLEIFIHLSAFSLIAISGVCQR